MSVFNNRRSMILFWFGCSFFFMLINYVAFGIKEVVMGGFTVLLIYLYLFGPSEELLKRHERFKE